MSNSTPPSNIVKKRWRGMRHAGDAASPILKPILQKRGFTEARLFGEWADIVGESLAKFTMPDRLQFHGDASKNATLTLRVAPPFALECQHLQPMLIEKLAIYFGYRAVSHITLKQDAALMKRIKPTKPAHKAAPLPSEISDMIATCQEPALQEALTRLGKMVAAGKARR